MISNSLFDSRGKELVLKTIESSTSRPPAPSTLPTAPPTSPTIRASSSGLLVPLLCSILGPLLLLLLLLLLLWVKYCKRKPNEKNVQSPVYSSVKTEEIQYSSVNIKTRGKGRVRRTEKENVQSPVYSSVKTEEIQYSSVNIKTRGKGRVRHTEKEENPVYSSVKTQDVCHSPIIINETGDAASWTKGRKTETK
uniref:Uncharacterized protein n=1 Tax=Knipowitschia caucasica TaxID=637954 RepID=A0AAV2KLU7_KNICA